MPTTFANTIDGHDIYAKRAECDAAGNTLSTTYATKSELPAIMGLTAGSNITITEGQDSITISATDTTYSAGTGLSLSGTTFSNSDPLPAHTSTESGKVLGVDSNGDLGWVNQSGGGGGGSYSAGTGIDITNDVISVDTSVVATQTDLATKEDAFDVGTGLEMDTSGATPTLQVEAPVDIVAGPGIVIDNPDGNTLRVSVAQAEEVVLCNTVSNSSCTLSEAYSNFERIRISFTHENPSTVAESFAFTPMTAEFYCSDIENNAGHKVTLSWCGVDGTIAAGSNNLLFRIGVWQFTSTTTFAKLLGKQFYVSWTGTDTSKLYVTRVVGIHRIAGGN